MKISITGKGSLGSLLEKLCWVLLFAGLVIVAALPWILDYYGSLFWQDLGTDYIRILLVLYPSAFMGLAVIWQLRKILVNVNGGQSFFSGKCPPGKERLDLLPGRRDPVFSRDRTLAIGADAGAGIFVFIRPGAGAVRACQTGRHL